MKIDYYSYCKIIVYKLYIAIAHKVILYLSILIAWMIDTRYKNITTQYIRIIITNTDKLSKNKHYFYQT
jgi:hypothetical protein